MFIKYDSYGICKKFSMMNIMVEDEADMVKNPMYDDEEDKAFFGKQHRC
jgi:hypothetical protein